MILGCPDETHYWMSEIPIRSIWSKVNTAENIDERLGNCFFWGFFSHTFNLNVRISFSNQLFG